MPKVSVCLAVYKTKPEYLRECIESILNQTFTDFEFLIVDDCPEDKECEKIIKSYNDNRIKYFRNEKNLGISGARNRLLDTATGEYIAVMDHDDISLPTRFEKQVAYLDTHPECGVVSCWYERFPNIKIKKKPEKNKQIVKALKNSCPLLHPAAMIRKSVLVENHLKYEGEFSPSEDYALWCRLVGKTSFHNVPEILFRYRDHETNESKKNNQKMKNATIKIRKEVLNTFYAENQNTGYILDKKFDLVLSLGSDCGCAAYLKEFKLRYASYPFDWLFKISFENRIKLIENHFKDFLVKENLKYIEKDPSAILQDSECDYYEDNLYGTQFLHDFISGVSFDISFQMVKEKYNRRIQRFYKNIQSAQNVLFVWRSKNEHLSSEKILQGYKTLCKVFPRTEIYLLIIENDTSLKKIIKTEVLETNIRKISADITIPKATDAYLLAKGNKQINDKIFSQIKCKKEPFSFANWFMKKYIKVFCMLIRPAQKRKLIKSYLQSQLLSMKD